MFKLQSCILHICKLKRIGGLGSLYLTITNIRVGYRKTEVLEGSSKLPITVPSEEGEEPVRDDQPRMVRGWEDLCRVGGHRDLETGVFQGSIQRRQNPRVVTKMRETDS